MPKGALLFQPSGYRHEIWTDHLRRLMPDLDIRTSEDAARAGDIVYCVAWKPKPRSLSAYPNLEVVFSMGAGVDGIVADPTYPKHVPLSRVVDDTLSQGMTESCSTRSIGTAAWPTSTRCRSCASGDRSRHLAPTRCASASWASACWARPPRKL